MVCAIGGSSEMSQIHVQLSHFLRLLVTVEFAVGGLQKCAEFGCSGETF